MLGFRRRRGRGECLVQHLGEMSRHTHAIGSVAAS
jgi:hypothetical protein